MSLSLRHWHPEIGHHRIMYIMEIGTSDRSGIPLFLISPYPPRSGLLVHHCSVPTVLPLPHAGKPQLKVKVTVYFLHVYINVYIMPLRITGIYSTSSFLKTNTFGMLSVSRETQKMLQSFCHYEFMISNNGSTTVLCVLT